MVFTFYILPFSEKYLCGIFPEVQNKMSKFPAVGRGKRSDGVLCAEVP